MNSGSHVAFRSVITRRNTHNDGRNDASGGFQEPAWPVLRQRPLGR